MSVFVSSFLRFFVCFNNGDGQKKIRSDLPGISFRKRNRQAKPCQSWIYLKIQSRYISKGDVHFMFIVYVVVQ